LENLRGAADGGGLRVLDFGGALGSTYFQYRRELTEVSNVTWAVVEQPMFVEAGRIEFESAELRFFPTVAAAQSAVNADVLILSGVVQCVEAPHALLAELLQMPWRLVVFDRVALHEGARDRLTVQTVPRSIYRASYPAWFFRQDRLMAHFAEKYRCVAEFINGDPGASGFRFMGFVFEPKSR
jgi:putative methyltransferase (TIGR04325 family)